MSTASRFNPAYTVTDYQGWEGDWELWNGVAIAMGPSPFGAHQSLAPKLGTNCKIEINSNRLFGKDITE